MIDMTSFAKALYDNEAETDDELSFRRGDVIEVLEKDFHGLDGWWLCYLRGKIGIAPSNRLQMTKEENENSMHGNIKCKTSKVVDLRVDGYYDDDPRGSTPNSHNSLQGNRRRRRRGRERRGGEFGGGGSCEDLLVSIDSPDGGSGCRKQDCGVSSGKVRSGAGGSCDDLSIGFLSIGCLSNVSSGIDVSRDYDTPVASIAPGNSFSRWKLHCEYSVSGKTEEAVVRKEIGFDQRSKYSGVRGVKDATGVKPKTMDDFLERDSFLTDYDVPKSHRQPSGDKIFIRNDSAGISPSPKGSNGKDFANREPGKPVPKAMSSNSKEANKSLIAGDQKFTNDVNEVMGAVDHVISYSNRWSMCRNPETVRLIVRQACLSVWTKLQALLTSFSKLLVRMRDPVVLKDHFGSMTVSAGRIEDILTSIARFRPNEASPDFVKELDATVQDIRTNIDRCVEILTETDDDHKASAQDISGALRARGQGPPVSSTNPKTDKRHDPLRLDRMKTMADVLLCKTNREAPSKTVIPSPMTIRDIQTPSPRRLPQKPSTLEEATVAIRRADRRHAADDVKVSRGAVVFGEERNCFRILERRCPGSPSAPTKLVAQSSSSERLNPSESVDYDLLRTRPEAEAISASGNAGSRGGAASEDWGVVEFYRGQVEVVLKQLSATYRSVVESLRAGSDGCASSGCLATEFRTLVVGFRRLGFICDTLARHAATSAAVRGKARSHSLVLVNDTRAMEQTFTFCVGAKWQPVSSRKMFLKRIEEMLRHSMIVADILY